jgi:PAS domain S-box-containing protein
MSKWKTDIEELKEQVINASYIVIGAGAAILIVLSVAWAIQEGFHFETGIPIAFLSIFLVVALFRKKIPFGLKTAFLLLLASVIFLYETIFWGILSSSELYIILILFFLTGFLSFRQSLLMTAIYVMAFLFIGYLFHQRILSLPEEYAVTGFSTKMTPWIISFVNLCIVAFSVLIVITQFTAIYNRTIASLRESESKYRSLSESASTGIWQVNKEGYTEYANPAMCKLLEVDRASDLSGIHFKSFYSEESLQIIHQENYKRLSGKSSTYEVVLHGKKGTQRNILVSASPLFNEEKEITGTIVSIVNITESKKAKEALVESEKKFREMMEFLPQIVFESDVNGTLTYANKNGQRLFGISDEDIRKGVHLLTLFDPDEHEKVKENTARILKGENLGGNEYTMLKNDKTPVPVEIYSSPIYVNQRPAGLRGVIIDITLRRKTEQELDKYHKHLEQLVKERTEKLHLTNEELIAANKELILQREELQTALDELNNAQQQLVESEKMASLGILAAGISHEINNPLNFIQGGLTGLEEYFNDNPAAHKKNVKILLDGIQEGITRASNIVASLNHFSRYSESQNEKCDIHDIIDNCLVILQNQLKHRITVNKSYTDRPFTLYGNEGKLHQAFLNILLNACQAIQDSGSISIKTETSQHDFLISVTDTGCGIKPEDLPKIFDPFFTTKAPGLGTGLGLSITYKIIQEHRGKIDYKSRLDEGTEVIIKLPKQ